MEDFTTSAQSSEQPTHRRGKIIAVAGIVLIASLLGGWYFGKHKKQAATSKAPGLQFSTYEDAVRSGRISATDQEVMLTVFTYEPGKNPELSITKLERYTHGTPDTAANSGDYKLEILRNNNVLYTDYMIKPAGQVSESAGSDNKYTGSTASAAQTIPKNLPWFDDKSVLRVSSDGKVILTKTLEGIGVTKNTPKFETINGEDVR